MAAEATELRVLVVDDDPDTCTILEQLLRHLGYAALTLTDSATALRHLADEQFHAVMLDLVMPGLSGFDLLRAARMHEQTSPVIAISAHSEFRHTAMESGFDAFIAKPVELSKLRPVLDRPLPA